MWMNLSGVVGAAIEKVQKLQNDIETQMDQAVGASTNTVSDNQSQSFSPHPDGFSRDEKELLKIIEPLDPSKHAEIEAKDIETELTSSSSIKQATDVIVPSTLSSKSESAKPAVKNDSPTPKKPSKEVSEKMKKEISSLQRSLEEEIRKYKMLENSSSEELNSLRKKIDEKETTFHDMEEKLKEKIRRIEHESEEKVSQLNQKIKEQLRTINSLELKNQELVLEMNSTKITSNSDGGKFNEDHARLLEEIRESNSKLNEKVAEISDLKEINDRLNQRIVHLQEEVLTWKSDLEKSKEAAKEKEKALEASTLKFSEFKEINDRLKQQLIDLQNELGVSKEDFEKSQEIIKERERALETATFKSSELYKQCEELQRKINDLKSEVNEKTNQNKQMQSTIVDENEIKRELENVRDQLREKSQKLEAFESEASKLSKKQSEMEKLVRKSKGDVKEKEAEIVKLKESKDQLVKAIEQTQDALRKQEIENANITKTLNAMTAVSQASSDKLNKLESELSSKSEELLTQRKALENSWSDNAELKRTITELKAERDDLRRQIGEGTSKAIESESFRREIEQREAILKATSLQLQENLRNQMAESLLREERLRDEIMELRKKWQDAISSREVLSSELSSATTPLLRQISSLQESLRYKTEQFQSVESQLMERVLRAENFNETFEQKRLFLEEQITSLKHQLSTITQKYNDSQMQVQNLELNLEKAKRNESIYLEERDEYEKKWSQEHLLKQNLSNNLREMELKFKLEMQEKLENYSSELAIRDAEINKLTKEVSLLREELNASKVNRFNPQNPFMPGNQLEEISLGEKSSTDFKDATATNSSQNISSDNSFVVNEKLFQKSQQKDQEIRILQMQLHQLQISRDALLDEVSYLSSRNTQLEEDTLSLPNMQQELSEKQKQIEVLLVLLGEKEEELEGLLSDMKEIKNMYKDQMEELLLKVLSFENHNHTTPKLEKTFENLSPTKKLNVE